MPDTPCDNCPLAGASNYVNPHGRVGSSVFVVGSAPGEDEVKSQRAFTGQTASILVELLDSLGLPKKDLWYTNVVKRRPVDSLGRGRRPSRHECMKCGHHLVQEMRVRQAELVLAVGQVALQFLAGADLSIRQMHGLPVMANQFGLSKDYRVFPVYDPGHIQRSGGILHSKKGDMWVWELEQFANEARKYV